MIIIYFTGCVLSYLTVKRHLMSEWKEFDYDWTVNDRAMCILVSIITSWIGFIVSLLMMIKIPKGDKPSKW